MLHKLVTFIGLIIIVAAFAFILHRPDMSLMDSMMKKQKKAMDDAIAKAEAEEKEKNENKEENNEKKEDLQ